MSLSLDADDWLKPAEENRDVATVTDLQLPGDFQLPDLGLPDISSAKWWVDLEFLDLASGPPANFASSTGHERAKNKNPTLGYNFPDIFFDTTSTSLFGSGADDSHKIVESFKDDFEKGLLADLFPATNVVSQAGDDLDMDSSATSDVSAAQPADSVKLSLDKEVKASVANCTCPSAASSFDSTSRSEDAEQRAEPWPPDSCPLKNPFSVMKPGALACQPAPPKGTLAKITIEVDKENQTTKFVIAPETQGQEEIRFEVQANNVRKATEMIRPLQLDSLPVFKKYFEMRPLNENGRPKQKRPSKQPKAGSPSCPDSKQRQFCQEMARFGVHLAAADFSHGKCPDCGKTFTKLCLLKEHLFHHRNIRPYKCTEAGCPWAFYTAFKLKRHKLTHSKQKDFVCNSTGCENRRFSTIYNLRAHLKIHDGPCSLRCELCPGEVFLTRKMLRDHVKASHPADSSPNKSNDLAAKAVYACSEPGCGRAFRKMSQFNSHRFIHTGERPFKCSSDGCQWAFRTVSKLRRHERSHRNERRFVCKLCCKSYIRSEHLNGHMANFHGCARARRREAPTTQPSSCQEGSGSVVLAPNM